LETTPINTKRRCGGERDVTVTVIEPAGARLTGYWREAAVLSPDKGSGAAKVSEYCCENPDGPVLDPLQAVAMTISEPMTITPRISYGTLRGGRRFICLL
jgi:hypothetical protein